MLIKLTGNNNSEVWVNAQKIQSLTPVSNHYVFNGEYIDVTTITIDKSIIIVLETPQQIKELINDEHRSLIDYFIRSMNTSMNKVN